MAADIPTKEPTKHAAGTTLKFDRSFPDFLPGDGWTLTYYLRNAESAPIDITSTTNNNDHRVNVPMATTADWIPGFYEITGWVTDGTEQHQVYSGEIEILRDVSVEQNYDHRTYAHRMLDLIEDVIAGRVTDGSVSYTINGRSFTAKTDEELFSARNYFKAEVRYEQSKGRKVLGRFRKAR